MTRKHDQTLHCPNCGIEMTTETSFGRWVRNNSALDSIQHGMFVMDADWIFHQFRSELGRGFQCFMMVEVKTRGANMTEAQRDTFHLINQIMRNRRQTPTSQLKTLQAGNGPLKTFSVKNGKWVTTKAFGIHLLQFENLGPFDSQWIKWDGKHITTDQLTMLLRFDLDPDTLTAMDWRRHHLKNQPADVMPMLFYNGRDNDGYRKDTP